MSCDYRSIQAVPLSQIDITSGARSMATVVVTPLDADRLLQNNENRKINQNTVLRYALMMEKGEWDWCDGDTPLKVGAGGVLRNGQHRLNAQVLANVTGVYDIRTGVPKESYRVMDSGVMRRASDYFCGREQATNVSALAKRIVYARYGYIEPTQSMRGAGDRGIPTRNEEIIFAEENYDRLRVFVQLAIRVRDQHKRGSVAAFACALWISGADDDEIKNFVDSYVEGSDETGVTKETVLKKLVDRNFKPRPHWFGGVTLMAMDAWLEGRGMKVLRQPDVVSRYKRAVLAFERRNKEGGE